MKNKHLVLLFLITLLIGLAVRRAPWRTDTFFKTNLLRLDTAEVQQIQITLPGKPPLFLLRSDQGWSADQSERSVNLPPDAAQEMLRALADLQSIRIVKTDRPDTLGFSQSKRIQLEILRSDATRETITLGMETLENAQAATYVELPQHEGIYLVNKHLRSVFTKGLTDFRNQTVAEFSPEKVSAFSLFGPNLDTLIFHRNDSTGQWQSLISAQVLPNEAVQQWLGQLAGVKPLPFADLFDESHAEELFYAQIQLKTDASTAPILLKIFKLSQLNIPEELPSQKPDRRQLTQYVLHSSQNPLNYFAWADTQLLNQICRPF